MELMERPEARTDIQEFKVETRELRAEIQSLRTEIREGFRTLRHELHRDRQALIIALIAAIVAILVRGG